MISGLYGCSGLPGGTTTQTWGNQPNFDIRSVSPVIVAENATTKQQRNIRHETGLRPEEIRRLVQALSVPELLHVLKSWHIEHPSGRPLGDKLHKHALADLIMEHQGALGDVIRVATAKSGAGGVGRGAHSISLCGARSATPGYSSLLRELGVRGPTHRPSSSLDILSPQAASDHLPTLSAQHAAPAVAAKAVNSVDALASPAAAAVAGRSRRRLHLTAKQRDLMRTLAALRAEVAAERAAREDCAVRLARRGLLSVALEAEMPPVARSRDLRVETVRRCGNTVGELHGPLGVNPHLFGVRVDALMRRAGAGPSAYGPSALTLCP